jgi:hypothetical protein
VTDELRSTGATFVSLVWLRGKSNGKSAAAKNKLLLFPLNDPPPEKMAASMADSSAPAADVGRHFVFKESKQIEKESRRSAELPTSTVGVANAPKRQTADQSTSEQRKSSFAEDPDGQFNFHGNRFFLSFFSSSA